MVEIRFHGRGGQGTVVASEILATALFKEDKFVQAFPTFGVERRGAPVAAFLRISDRPIRLRCQIERPDHVIVLDPTLLPVIDVSSGLKPGGWILINSEHDPDSMTRFTEGGWRVATVDASAIAASLQLGSRTNPIVNTSILGAFASVTGLVSIDSVTEAIREGIPIKPEANIEAAITASRETRTSLCEEVSL
jgi:2-oxoacid:acceptor oxidoreductase gamma subunit (pyruvate/2-ketoisovalerate family)